MQDFVFYSLDRFTQRRELLSLLLTGDPSEKWVNSYIHKGEMFAVQDGTTTAGVILLTPVSDTVGEIMNLAVDEAYRGRGLGRQLIEHAIAHTHHHYQRLMVGTNDACIDFYAQCGFTYSHRVPDFYTRHYSQPIFHGEQQLVGMVYLQRRLLPQ